MVLLEGWILFEETWEYSCNYVQAEDYRDIFLVGELYQISLTLLLTLLTLWSHSLCEFEKMWAQNVIFCSEEDRLDTRRSNGLGEIEEWSMAVIFIVVLWYVVTAVFEQTMFGIFKWKISQIFQHNFQHLKRFAFISESAEST